MVDSLNTGSITVEKITAGTASIKQLAARGVAKFNTPELKRRNTSGLSSKQMAKQNNSEELINYAGLSSGDALTASFENSIGKLVVSIVSAKNLPALDIGETSDPYVVLELGEGPMIQVYRTRVMKKNLNPQWNQDFILLVTDVNMNLIVKVWDWNRLNKDTLIGELQFPVSELMKSPNPLRVSTRAKSRFYPILSPSNSDESSNAAAIVSASISSGLGEIELCFMYSKI